MAPKKTTDLSQNDKRKRVPKAKLAKPKQKTPSIIKVQIKRLGSAPKVKRNVTVQEKIELANEVALAQLVKSPSEDVPDTSKLMPSPVPSKTPMQKTTHIEIVKQSNKTNSVRKRKLTSNDAQNDSEATLVATADTTKSKRQRKKTPNLSSPRDTLSKIVHTSSENPQISLNETPVAKKAIKSKPKTKATPVHINKAQTLANGHGNSAEVSEEPVSSTAKRPGRKKQQKTSYFFPEVPTFATSSESSVSDTPAKKEEPRKRPIPNKKPPVKATTRSSVLVAARKTRGQTKLENEKASIKKELVNKKVSKCKVLDEADIKTAAFELENALNNTDQVAQVENNSVKSCHSIKSNNSSLSWTRDISTSSATTCVTVSSHDFVRFNNKLPIVQLHNDCNVKQEVEKDSSSSSSDSDSSESSSSENNSHTDEISRPELNLSKSSLSIQSKQSGTGNMDSTKLLNFEMDKLTTSLKNFNEEMQKYIVCDDDENFNFDKVFAALDLERNLVTNCENFAKSIMEEVNDKVIDRPVPRSPENSVVKVEFVKPSLRNLSLCRRGGKAPNLSATVPSHSAVVKNTIGEKGSGSLENLAADKSNDDVPLDKTYDDEDALSLFAESITGIELTRCNSSAASISNVSSNEAYVPKPKTTLPDMYTYKPTKIDADPQIPKTICEKQNADSTSIRDSDIKKTTILNDASERLSSLAPVSMHSQNKNPPGSPTKPRLFGLDSLYPVTNPVKSRVYRGICYFYLIDNCQNPLCRFPHTEPQKNSLEKTIRALTEDQLIGEYLLTRSYPPLRRKFGMLFVNECMRRDSTRILMDMAIHFGLNCVSREDHPLRVSCLECALMHLNTVSLEACDDLLKVESSGLMLCDVLLRSIAESQNFARFKPVFIKLSEFMLEIGRRVDVDVVGKILERVCILPCEGPLAQAMLDLIRNTDRIIFQDRMTEPFETQLSKLEGNVYEEYLLLKKAAIEAMLEQPYVRERPIVDGYEVVTRTRYTSPDTTNIDGSKMGISNTPALITRTVDCVQSTVNTTVRHSFKQPAMPPPRHFANNQYNGTGWRPRPMRGINPQRRVMYRHDFWGGPNI